MSENSGPCLKNKSYIVFKKNSGSVPPTLYHSLGGVLKSELKPKCTSASGFDFELVPDRSTSGKGSARKNV